MFWCARQAYRPTTVSRDVLEYVFVVFDVLISPCPYDRVFSTFFDENLEGYVFVSKFFDGGSKTIAKTSGSDVLGEGGQSGATSVLPSAHVWAPAFYRSFTGRVPKHVCRRRADNRKHILRYRTSARERTTRPPRR